MTLRPRSGSKGPMQLACHSAQSQRVLVQLQFMQNWGSEQPQRPHLVVLIRMRGESESAVSRFNIKTFLWPRDKKQSLKLFGENKYPRTDMQFLWIRWSVFKSWVSYPWKKKMAMDLIPLLSGRPHKIIKEVCSCMILLKDRYFKSKDLESKDVSEILWGLWKQDALL